VTRPSASDAIRIAAALALSLLIAMLLPFTAGAAEDDATRTEGLGGYSSAASAAPASILFYEPVFPIPVDPGQPSAEGTLSYTSSQLETGPSSRAVASSTWPGPAVGDGFATICDCDQEWFVKAEARDPGGKEEAAQEVPELHSGMQASAKGLDAVAKAGSGESPNPEGMAFGSVRSRSESTVEKGAVVTRTLSSAKDVAIGGGVITIESVTTTMEATSNGKKAVSDGTTKVNGLVIAGQGYTIDENGLQPVAEEKPEESVLPLPQPKEAPGAEELRKELGIEVELAQHKQSKAGPADVSRTAGGLRISIKTAVLKDRLPLYESVPEDLAGQLAPLLVLAPQIDYVFGRGAVRAAANPPLTIDLPTLEPPAPPADAPAGLASGDTSFPDTAAEDTALPEIAAADTAGAVGPVEQPLAAPEQAQPASSQLPALFGGLPPGLVAAGIAIAAVGGRALAGFTGAAMGGAGGAFCDRGALRKVPDLRSGGARSA
jgi:hypothetical protein